MSKYLSSFINWSIANWEFLVAIITLLFTLHIISANSKTKRQEIFYDLVKEESLLWDRMKNVKRKDIKVERVVNFYDTLALLYLEGIIDKKLTEKHFKEEFKRVCETHKKSINKNFNHLIKLRDIWK